MLPISSVFHTVVTLSIGLKTPLPGRRITHKFLRILLFFLGIKQSTSVWVLTQKTSFLAKFYSKFATFLHFFSFLEQKTLKMTISTSVWGEQHPNAGQNIQQWIVESCLEFTIHYNHYISSHDFAKKRFPFS